jgi:O-antigen/teichoic acid export membrane protein
VRRAKYAAGIEPAPVITDDNVGNAIIRGGVLRVFAFSYSAALGVVATAVISRVTGPAGFAEYVTAMSLITIAISLSDFGLVPLGMREFTALEEPERTRSLRALITLRLVLAALAGVVIVGFAWLDSYPQGLVTGLALAAVGLVFIALHFSYVVPIQATFRLNTIAWLEALRQTLIVVPMIVAAIVTEKIGVVIASYLPAGIVIAVVTGLIARKISSIVPSLDFAAMGRLLRHVGTFAVAATVSTTYAFIAQIVSNSVLSERDSGLFGLAFRVFAVLVGAGMAAIGGAFPLLVAAVEQDDRERYDYAVRRLLQTAALAGAFCAVALVTGASVAIAILGGAEFAGAEGAVQFVGLALPASFMVLVGGAALLAVRQHGRLLAITLIGASSSIVATWLLASNFGMYGAVGGIVIGENVLAVGYLWGVSRVSKVAVPRARWLLGILAVGAFSCLPALLPIAGVFSLALGAAIFAAAVLGLGIVPPELVDNARGLAGNLSGRSGER